LCRITWSTLIRLRLCSRIGYRDHRAAAVALRHLPRHLFHNSEGIAAALALKLNRHAIDSGSPKIREDSAEERLEGLPPDYPPKEWQAIAMQFPTKASPKFAISLFSRQYCRDHYRISSIRLD
jgi:hypothetical protein